MQLVDKLIYYMQYPFVKYALVVGILIALCSSLFGATLVLKRFSFIGDGLSHVAFGAMAVGSVLKLTNNTIIVMPVTVAAAILILMSGQNAKLKGDAAIAMMSVGALAVGYLIMNVFSTSANVSGDVCSTLFGSTSILTLTMGEVWLCIVMSICVIAFFCLFYNRIFAVTFDESFTRAIGKNAGAYNLALAVIIAVIIVLAMNLVGSCSSRRFWYSLHFQQCELCIASGRWYYIRLYCQLWELWLECWYPYYFQHRWVLR